MLIEITVEKLAHFDPALPLPDYATEGAAGADLRASFPEGERAAGVTLAPGARAAVPTGLAMAIPPGWELQIRPRSGLAARHGVTVLNAPGTIDSDYRGEVKALLVNLGAAPFRVEHGARIAQALVAPAPRILWREGALGDTARGAGGFGSTGGR